ncbi:MAG: hypothetical protein EOP90_07195 [Lysobacteraceae bacterium]|nr:MAG: hypothetical protein EOP90_07195 [Xanthomonadaceae bacterium]
MASIRTSLYTILCIAIRLAAVSLALTAFAGTLTLLASLGTSETRGVAWYVVGSVGLTLAIAFLLWTWPGVLARLAAGRSSAQVSESPISPEQIQWIALSVLGAWFALEGFVSLCWFAMQNVMYVGVQDVERHTTELIQTGAYWLIQMLVGIALLFGARGLSGLLRRLRDGSLRGGPPPVADDGDPSVEWP